MNKFNRKMVDSMLGWQDERERLETYERMAVCYAYLYWGSILVGLGSWIMGWKDGEVALWLWFLLVIPLRGWAKVSWSECNDLSSTVIAPSEKITPETAKGILRRALKNSLVFSGGICATFFVMMKRRSPEAPNLLILFFVGLIFLFMVVGCYCSADMKVKKALREPPREDKDEEEDED